MADVAIINRATVAAPKDYALTQGQELLVKAVRAVVDGSSATQGFLPALQLVAPDGTVMWTAVPISQIAAAGSADCSWFPDVEEGVVSAGETIGVASEVVYYDTINAGTPLAMSTALVSGAEYVLVVEGTWSLWNEALGVGSPEAEAQFPGSHAGRVSTQVGLDADTIYARPTDKSDPLGHSSLLLLSLDGGVTYSHVEPVGGPYTTPQTGHLYRFQLTGQGNPLHIKVIDVNPADNYGKLRFTLQVPSGTGTGSGAGGLVPESDTTLNGDVLTVVSGIPAWAAPTAGGITTLASPGGTISVTNPTGPTADVDLPSSGVAAGSYGSSTQVPRVTVNAEGILTAVANVGIGGLPGSGLVQLYANTLALAGTLDTGAGGVPGGHGDLLVIATVQTNSGSTSGVFMQLNADAASTYTQRWTFDATLSTTSLVGGISFGMTIPNNAGTLPAVIVLFIPRYDDTTVQKTAMGVCASVGQRISYGGSAWPSTAAITQIMFGANIPSSIATFKAGCRLVIYGTQ